MNRFNQPLKKISLIIAATLLCQNIVAAEEQTKEQAKEQQKNDYIESMIVVGQQDDLSTEAGSSTYIDEEALQDFEYDDINRILASVPGVNIRQEDGYGLRPNIGFRGVTPERSKKINIMEDGILVGPAPYSAPAAYYFPMVSRMTAVEVFKGPSAIQYGPNTVAGTLNMLTRQVSQVDEGMLDVAVGSDAYAKTHGFFNKSQGDFGFLIEGIHIQADGFKQLDGGGDTGFDKNDLVMKFRYDMDTNQYDQVWELKLGYADEVSDETYLGLTDQDFSANPYRRYQATQLDKMEWTHTQVQLNHFISGDDFDVTTRVYRNDFERDWFKLNRLKASNISTLDPAPSLQALLQDPVEHENYYQLLTAERDTESQEALVLGLNHREYYSQGIQSDFRMKKNLFDLQHTFKIGLRFHQDEIKRNHTEDDFAVINHQLSHKGLATVTTTLNTETADAISIYLQDTISWDKLELTLGVRGEFIDSEYQNGQNPTDWIKKESSIWLPGVSVFYALDDNQGLFAGMHQGFVPTSPKQSTEVDIEESTAYELGYRIHKNDFSSELVLFFNDFKNLKEACTFSADSACVTQIDQEYNGGEVESLGLEASFEFDLAISDDYNITFAFIYTYTQAEFQSSFESDFGLWGNISKGDSVPYLPEHQATLNIGLQASDWQIKLSSHYVSSMMETAGSGEALSGVKTSSMLVLDLTANYDLTDASLLYFKIDNVLDEAEIISRRPFGARPNKPRQFYLGYKYLF